LYKLVVSNGGAEGLEIGVGYASGRTLLQSYNRSGATYNAIDFAASSYNFTTGNVGIGTGNPTALLHLSQSITNLNIYLQNTSGSGKTWAVNSDSNGSFNIHDTAVNRLSITSGGNVLINTTTDAGYELYVNGGSTNGALFYSTSAANQIKAAGTAPAITFTNTITSPTIGGVLGAATTANQFVTGTVAGDVALINQYTGALIFGTVTERMRITSGGNVLFQKTAANNTDTGAGWFVNDYFCATNNSADSGDRVVLINRQNSDGTLIDFRQANVTEGSISVSGTTVSYNGGHLSRYSQTELNEKIEGLLKGTVMSNLDKMAEWINPETKEPYENEQLNCMKISDVEGDKNVAGVFVNWEYDSELLTNDMNIAMTGDMIIRIAQGLVVEKGDLLISGGDGTAKPQSDDLIRSNTIAKVTSNHITCVYEDGSYCVPCVLMAC
jgi:hypothetical protein